MENLASSARASTPSRALRSIVRFELRKMLRASCWVIVDVARRRVPVVAETQVARANPMGSTPGCMSNRRSSTEIIASRMTCGISS